MTETKIIKRKCIVTNTINPISEMVRFDYQKATNKIQLDLNHSAKGRGAYFLPTVKNWAWILKHKGLNRAFRINVNKDIYDEIEQQLKEAKCLKETE